MMVSTYHCPICGCFTKFSHLEEYIPVEGGLEQYSVHSCECCEMTFADWELSIVDSDEDEAHFLFDDGEYDNTDRGEITF